MFITLEGHGTLRVAGERLPIKAGVFTQDPPLLQRQDYGDGEP